MKIMKFTGNNMTEVMKQIKAKLGNDAIILSRKEVKSGGIFGLFKKKRIEVTAALDTEPLPKKKQQPPVQMEKPVVVKNEMETNEIIAEIKHLKQMLATQAFHSEHNFVPEMENMYRYLLDQEVDKSIAVHLTNVVAEKFNPEQHKKKDIKAMLEEAIQQLLQDVSFHGIADETKVIQFVGPTGVGKTTTLAKIAAYSMLNQHKKIAFITADTYRIAAIEQLKTYAKILDVPIKVVYSEKDYKDALFQFAHYDQIYVDTAGRNYREEQFIKELEQMIQIPTTATETYLVLSLTAKAQDIHDLYLQFKPLNIKRVIFTKLDETNSYGSMLNLCVEQQIDIPYLTNGQNVPEDLLTPNEKMLSKLIVRRY